MPSAPGGPRSCVRVNPFRPALVCGDESGNVNLLELVRTPYGPLVVFGVDHRDGLLVGSPCCLDRSVIEDQRTGQVARRRVRGCEGRLPVIAASHPKPPRWAFWKTRR
jgi:hypothetical protein